MTTAMGLDLSLAATGLVVIAAGDEVVEKRLIKTKKSEFFDDTERYAYIRDEIMRSVVEHSPSAIVIEGPAFAKLEKRTYELAGAVKVHFYDEEHPFVMMQPNTLKKEATGNGRATKDDMVVAAQEFDPEITDHNLADALHLARQAWDLIS